MKNKSVKNISKETFLKELKNIRDKINQGYKDELKLRKKYLKKGVKYKVGDIVERVRIQKEGKVVLRGHVANLKLDSYGNILVYFEGLYINNIFYKDAHRRYIAEGFKKVN